MTPKRITDKEPQNMSIRRTRFSRTGAAAVALATGLVLGVTGCSGDAPSSSPEQSGTSADQKESGGDGKTEEVPASDTVLKRVEGPNKIVLTLHEVKRDSGGFVTVSGAMENTGDEDFYGTGDWSGNETEIVKHGGSLGGATLIDKAEKKRYYVLRDTEGRPLCTTFPNDLPAGKTVPVFAQFPAPPEGTEKVDFQIPGWPTVPVEISG
jgi:hypothetical protein